MFVLLFYVILCSKYDLYSKSKVRVDVEKVKPYYLSLIEKVSAAVQFLSRDFDHSPTDHILIGREFYCSISQQS